jgi:hypothetical protein
MTLSLNQGRACLTPIGGTLILADCTGGRYQLWTFNNGHLYDPVTGECFGPVTTGGQSERVGTVTC